MITSIIGLVLVTLGLVALALQRFYSSIPAKELKRLTARGDHLAGKLYQAVAYGASLRLFLWLVVSGGLTGGILLIGRSFPAWVAFLAVSMLLIIGFVLLQSARLTVRTAGFAAFMATPLAALLGRIEPVSGRITHQVKRRRAFDVHSGLYEKEDLVDLLAQQKEQVDNRINHEELELARRALHFHETQAADIVIKRLDMKNLKTDDAIGPILLEELHKSKQPSFVVYDTEGEHIAGIVHMQDALRAKQGGKVSGVMTRDIVYVHEDFTLRQVLDVVLRSGQPFVLVINGFEELVGAISLEALIQELLGGSHLANLPYQDRAAVAAYRPEAVLPASDDAARNASSQPVQPDIIV